MRPRISCDVTAMNRASRSLKVPREASVVHTDTEFATLARYGCAGMMTSKNRLRGSLQSTPGNLMAGSSDNLDVKHKQLSWKKIEQMLAHIQLKKATMSVKTVGVSFIPEYALRKQSKKSTYSSRANDSGELSNHPRRLKDRCWAEKQYVALSIGRLSKATGSKVPNPLTIPALRLMSERKTSNR